MSEANKAVMKRWIDALNQGKTAVLQILDEMTTPDYRLHDSSGEVTGRPAVREFVGGFFDALPDLKITIEEVIAEADHVACRFTMTGTHKGALMGIPASGNRVQTTFTTIVRMMNGKFAEEWQTWDFHGFLQQLSSKAEEGKQAKGKAVA